MKKLLSLLLALAMLLGCAALAEEAFDYTGFWTLIEVQSQGMSFAPEDLSVDMSIVVYEDGLCDMYAMNEAEEGVWVYIEGGIAVTDSDQVTMNLMLQEDGTLTAEQDGMTMVFAAESYALPLTNLTLADFEGSWTFVEAEYMGQFVSAEELGSAIELTITGNQGHVVIADAEGAEECDAICELEEVPDFGTLVYFLFVDEAGVPTGDGMMLIKFQEDELVWYTLDEEENDVFYCFQPAQA